MLLGFAILLPHTTKAAGGLIAPGQVKIGGISSNASTFYGRVTSTFFDDPAICWFEYYSNQNKVTKTAPLDCTGPVTVHVAGLKSGTNYFVRLATKLTHAPLVPPVLKGKLTTFTTLHTAKEQKNKDYIPNNKVAVTVFSLFRSTFVGINISPGESVYWKNRARTDLFTVTKLRAAMIYQRDVYHRTTP